MYGKISNMNYDIKNYGRSSFYMTMDIASGEDKEAKYNILQIIGGGILVRSDKHKNEFVLSLNDILDMAIEAGINREPKEFYTPERIAADRDEFERRDCQKVERDKQRKKELKRKKK
jgi:hypothetical protein